MNTFQSNIINMYGKKGKVWLDELPKLVTAVSSRLGLRDLALHVIERDSRSSGNPGI